MLGAPKKAALLPFPSNFQDLCGLFVFAHGAYCMHEGFAVASGGTPTGPPPVAMSTTRKTLDPYTALLAANLAVSQISWFFFAFSAIQIGR